MQIPVPAPKAMGASPPCDRLLKENEMKHEAKFSVIMPGGNFSTAQIETFEKTAQRYGLSIALPLRSGGSGCLILASGLSLRDAQLLRRQVAGLGYPADVVSDASESTRANDVPLQSSNTLVVELGEALDHDSADPVSDITSDAWSSLEIPQLDLGLSDGDDIGDDPKWKKENWLRPAATEQTLSISAKELLKVAKERDLLKLSSPDTQSRDAQTGAQSPLEPPDTASDKPSSSADVAVVETDPKTDGKSRNCTNNAPSVSLERSSLDNRTVELAAPQIPLEAISPEAISPEAISPEAISPGSPSASPLAKPKRQPEVPASAPLSSAEPVTGQPASRRASHLILGIFLVLIVCFAVLAFVSAFITPLPFLRFCLLPL